MRRALNVVEPVRKQMAFEWECLDIWAEGEERRFECADTSYGMQYDYADKKNPNTYMILYRENHWIIMHAPPSRY